MPIKTPGVYIVEKNAFPNSVVEVAAAVPAFIGHTEKADNRGKSLLNRPWRISSMAEFVQSFGGRPQPRFRVELAGASAPAAPAPTEARGQSSELAWNGRRYRFTRAAGRAGGLFLLYRAMQHFFQNGGGPCYIVSVGGYGADIDAGTDTTGLLGGLLGGLPPLLKEQEPTMVVVPDAVLLDAADCARVQQQLLRHCGVTMRSRMALLDVWGGDRARDDAELGWDCVDHFRRGIGSDGLAFGAAYHPWLHSSLVQASELDHGVFGDDRVELVDLLKADLGISASSDNDDARLKQARAALEDLLAAPPDPDAHKAVTVLSGLYGRLMTEARHMVNLMPPSAAMAGVYTMVDNTRGVWSAPANVSINSVESPAVDISDDEQADLNAPADGKSINALRSFPGQGVLVWGARTLDGNSPDWRYVNVRRTMIMLEQSCRLAAQAMVFEPNVATTWVTVKTMIANFLTGVWKRGGLAGAAPDDAFSVHVGLGETMTAADVAASTLRVTVRVAVSRPAEFIEITFELSMQKS